MSPNRTPHRKARKLNKRERVKYGACKSCVFTYKKKRRVPPGSVRVGNLANTEKKRKLVMDKGGKCEACGYDKCLAALTFHHLDGGNKAFTISKNLGKPMDILEEEAAKCSLLCLNCHAELNHNLVVGEAVG